MKTIDERISQVTTTWTEIFLAIGHADGNRNQPITTSAQQNVLRKYGGCVFRYLLGATRCPDTAEELSQEFAFRFIRGDLNKAHPAKGRFRDYLRVVLQNLVNDHFRRQSKSMDVLQTIRNQDVNTFDELERQFKAEWREKIIETTWLALREEEQTRGHDYHTVLKYRADLPKATSIQMSKALSQALGKPVTAEWVRQKLHRGRQRFATILLGEVKRTIEPQDDFEQLLEELADLQLLELMQDLHPNIMNTKIQS